MKWVKEEGWKRRIERLEMNQMRNKQIYRKRGKTQREKHERYLKTSGAFHICFLNHSTDTACINGDEQV